MTYLLAAKNLLKDPEQLTMLIMAGVLVLLVIVSIIIAALKGRAVPLYDKDEFVHKVMKHDYTVQLQLVTFIELALLVTAIVLYFTDVLIGSLIALGVLVVLQIYAIYLRLLTKRSRIEYNTKEVQKYTALGGKPTVIKWEDVKEVLAAGTLAQDRKIIFVGKNNKKIKISAKMIGFYDFMVFAESKFEGKKFEAIKIAKARQ